ncbi:hypothetical protein NC652_033138 [Populus alba x Populus x berolinensis]|nr:hypothetical protein NC652_033138 [Populus alba x Populus x berolinensis]
MVLVFGLCLPKAQSQDVCAGVERRRYQRQFHAQLTGLFLTLLCGTDGVHVCLVGALTLSAMALMSSRRGSARPRQPHLCPSNV